MMVYPPPNPDVVWFVGIVYQDSIRPFYKTRNFILARQMFRLLDDLGYKNVATNAHHYEILD